MSELSVGDKVILLEELHLNIGRIKDINTPHLPSSFPAGTIGEIKILDEENLAAVDFGPCTVWVRLESLCSVKDVVGQAEIQKIVVQIKTPVGWILGGNAKNNPEDAPDICPDPTGEGSAWQGVRSVPNPPPPGYELATHGQKRKPGYLWKPGPTSVWEVGYKENEGLTVESFAFVANPVDTGDVQKKLDLQWEAAKAVEQERNELQKKVEELTAERDVLREKLAKIREVAA